MPEFFVVTNSFAAPFVSDQDTLYQEAETAAQALKRVAAEYRHPMGLFAAAAYASADAYHKTEPPLARWLCNHQQAVERVTADLHGYSYLSHGPGRFEVDGVEHQVRDPKGGSVVMA